MRVNGSARREKQPAAYLPTSCILPKAQVHVGKTFASGATEFDLSIGARYRDKDLNAYLVGVSAAEATFLRPAYSPDATLSPIAQISAILPISQNAVLIGSLSYEWFGDEYDDSPLVERGNAASAGLGIIYRF